MFRLGALLPVAVTLAACESVSHRCSEPLPAPLPPADATGSASLVCPEPEPCACPELECPDQAPAAPVAEPVVCSAPAAVPVAELPVFGAIEWVSVGVERVRARARIDTGAQTSSLHAEHVVGFERDGRAWVRFVFDGGEGVEPKTFSRRVKRRVRIKGQDGQTHRRYVVEMALSVGQFSETIEVTLNNRAFYEFPVLIGRNFLTDNAVVDVSRQFFVDDRP